MSDLLKIVVPKTAAHYIGYISIFLKFWSTILVIDTACAK